MALTVINTWMETPDVLGFRVNDASMTAGNLITGDFSGDTQRTYIQKQNPANSNTLEYGQAFGPNEDQFRFAVKLSTEYLDRLNTKDETNWTITGGASPPTVSWVAYSNNVLQAAPVNPSGTGFQGTSWRHYVYLKLSSAPTPGQTYTFSNSASNITDFEFTFNEKTTRAGGIKVSQIGFRYNDSHRKAYLCSRIPTGPNVPDGGVVDFANDYGITTAYLIDEDGNTWGGAIPITLRKAWNSAESDDGYSTNQASSNYDGIDVMDMGTAYSVTGLTAGSPTTVTCVGHPFVDGDRVRFWGTAGFTKSGFNLDNKGGLNGSAAEKLWIGHEVTKTGDDTFTIPVDSTGCSAFSSGLYDETLSGGYENKVFKCINTNRAGTNVYEIVVPKIYRWGNYRIWIPEYGVSDEFAIDGGAVFKDMAAQLHRGLRNYRLGCSTPDNGSGFTRGESAWDGKNGVTNYWSLLPACLSSETAGNWGTTTRAAAGAYAQDNSPGFGTGNGWVTSERATGSRPAHQDAGDNDDIGIDHLPHIATALGTLLNIPKSARNTPYTVEYSHTLMDATLYAGSSVLPPMAHEIAWHLDAYRLTQRGTGHDQEGAVCGGWGLGWNAAQVPGSGIGSFESIDQYVGTDAGGSLAGQTVHMFLYAADHQTTFMYATCAALFAKLCYEYDLNDLGDTYKTSAIAAFDWANSILTDLAAREEYYTTTLGVKSHLSLTDAQWNALILIGNARAAPYRSRASCALFALLGATDGAVYEANITGNSLTVSSITAGGSSYAVGDTITLTGTNPAVLNVTTVSGGAVTAATVQYGGVYSSAPSNPVSQASTSGSGTGFQANMTANLIYSTTSGPGQTPVTFLWGTTTGANATAVSYVLEGHADDGGSSSPSSLAAKYLSTNNCFDGMWYPNSSGNTDGTDTITGGRPDLMLWGHLIIRRNNSFSTTSSTVRDSVYLKSMQACFGMATGANIPGKCWITGKGARPVEQIMMDDQQKKGLLAPPYGVVPFGYFAWGTGLYSFNFATGLNNDSTTNWIGTNPTGDWEASAQKGSTKIFEPPAHAQSYWEHSPECYGLIFQSEYAILPLFSSMAMMLYLAAWDDPTDDADELTPGNVVGGHML